MRLLRLFVTLAFLATPLGTAAASACEHEAGRIMTDHAAHQMAADEVDDAPAPHDCDQACCEGACLCDGCAVTAVVLPSAQDEASAPAALPAPAPAARGVAYALPADGPPPRTL